MKFSELASYFEQLEATSSRLTITDILAGLFRKVDAEEIGPVCYLLEGRVAPLFEPTEFGIADKFMIRAIAESYDISVDDVLATFRKAGDVGTAAQTLWQQETRNKKQEKDLSIGEVFAKLLDLTAMNGEGSQEKKIHELAMLISSLDGLSIRYLIRIPLGKMRLGLSDMTILDALSWMLTGDKSHREALENAYNLRPDIGYIATKVKADGIKGVHHVSLKIGTPVLSALCSRIPTADEMIKKMGQVAVEPKYDGVRVQIHWDGKKSVVRTFSRNLESTTVMFPELNDLAKHVNAESVILDAEAVGINKETGAILDFQETTTRKRKHGIEQALFDVPLKFFVFDILYKNGEELLSTPLSHRKELLKKTIRSQTLLECSPYIVADDPEKIRTYHHEQLEKGLEGVVVKKWESPYQPGRKGYTWVKFKEEEGKRGKLTDTIDAVVMGYYLGEGKRVGFGIGAFLVGVRDEDSFVTITKIGTGVTDDLWKSLVKDFDTHKVREKPKEYKDVSKLLLPDVWIEPHIVVEIAGDDLTKSPNHGSLYAVRFPRLVKIRTDKSVREITTKEEIETLYLNQ